jgi:hypothetical protein
MVEEADLIVVSLILRKSVEPLRPGVYVWPATLAHARPL